MTNLSVLGGKREQGAFSRVMPLLTSPGCSQPCPGNGFVSVGETTSPLTLAWVSQAQSKWGESNCKLPSSSCACLPHPTAREGTGTPQSNLWPFLDHSLLSARRVDVGSWAALGNPSHRPVPSERRLCLLLQQAARTRVPHSARQEHSPQGRDGPAAAGLPPHLLQVDEDISYGRGLSSCHFGSGPKGLGKISTLLFHRQAPSKPGEWHNLWREGRTRECRGRLLATALNPPGS